MPPLSELTVTELICTPSLLPTTFTEIVQVALAASEAPAKVTVFEPGVAVTTPPQVVVKALGVATSKPAGRASVKLTPVNEVPEFGLVMLNVRLVLEPTGIASAVKLLLMLGGITTVMVAVEVLPAPPLAEVTVTELLCNPPAVPVTLTEKVQLADAASEAPERLTEEDPAVAVIGPPPQEPVSPLGVDTTKPDGSMSVKATPVSVVFVFELVMVKLRLALPPKATVDAPKPFMMAGGLKTAMLAVPVLPVPPLVEVTETELFLTPSVLPVTFTEKVQLADAASVAPDRLTEVDPAVAVMIPPPQTPVSPLGVETTSPAGSESVKATPVRLVAAFGLLTVKLRLVLPPTAIAAAPKLLLIDGGPVTVTLAVAVSPVPPLVDVT